jgi:phosphate:Na+ symporter
MLGRILLPLVFVLMSYGFWASSSFQDISAGVALFLFGMFCMEQGFKIFSGSGLQALLTASTDRLWKSLSFGVVSTTLMQSSSLVSVLTISFLSAQLIGLAQGIGIVFGANLGTTTGAWIIAGFGLKVKISAYAMPLLVFGVILLMRTSERAKGAGWILIGIGFLFLGIHFMKEGFASYAEAIDLTQYAIPGIAGLLIFTLIGILATIVMQSSHATMTLIITALAASQITYDNALALAIGSNVGTTVTAVLGSLSANIAGKRLAGAHLIFNLVTGLVALVLIQPLAMLVDAVSAAIGIAPDDHTMKLAVFHTLFNLLGVLLMIPMIDRLVIFLETHLREETTDHDTPNFLSTAALDIPAVALHAGIEETAHLFKNATTLIAHGACLKRSLINSNEDLQTLIEPRGDVIPIDIEASYEKTIRDIQGANITFLTKAQARATGDDVTAFSCLRQANADVVTAIKAVKHLRTNLVRHMRSDNIHVRREYNRFRVRIASTIRDLTALNTTDDVSLRLLALDQIKVDARNAEQAAQDALDKLIRDAAINSDLATSLINDANYTRIVVNSLIGMTEAWNRAIQSDNEVENILSLEPDEIESIARQVH